MNDEIRNKVLRVLPHLRFAQEEAKKVAGEGGRVLIGIISVKPDGAGKVLATFEAGEFIEDIAALIDAPALTEEVRQTVRAERFLIEMGLTK